MREKNTEQESAATENQLPFDMKKMMEMMGRGGCGCGEMMKEMMARCGGMMKEETGDVRTANREEEG